MKLVVKKDYVDAIARLIGVPAPAMSTGSTEPKKIFELINKQCGLGLDPRLDKQALAREIVEAAGLRWTPPCESRGATITKAGLAQVLLAVQAFVSG